MTKQLRVVVGVCKETFRPTGPNPGGIELSGVIAIILVCTFALTAILQACNIGTIPELLKRPVDVALGWAFGMGTAKWKAKQSSSENKQK